MSYAGGLLAAFQQAMSHWNRPRNEQFMCELVPHLNAQNLGHFKFNMEENSCDHIRDKSEIYWTGCVHVKTPVFLNIMYSIHIAEICLNSYNIFWSVNLLAVCIDVWSDIVYYLQVINLWFCINLLVEWVLYILKFQFHNIYFSRWLNW